MATLFETLSIAFSHHRSGRFGLAEEIYRRILAVEPGHAEATHLLGTAASQQGRYEEGVTLIQRAIEIDATQPDYFFNLGEAFRNLGRIPEAVASYRKAVELKPSSSRMHSNYLCALRYDPDVTLCDIAQAHAEYDQRHAASFQSQCPPARR